MIHVIGQLWIFLTWVMMMSRNPSSWIKAEESINAGGANDFSSRTYVALQASCVIVFVANGIPVTEFQHSEPQLTALHRSLRHGLPSTRARWIDRQVPEQCGSTDHPKVKCCLRYFV